MPAPTKQLPDKARFGRAIERDDGADFPFYDGLPIEVSGVKWLIIVIACAAGFAVLSLVTFADQLLELIPRVLFAAIPLLVFMAFTGRYWGSIFRRVRGRDVLTMIIFWLINLAVTTGVGAIVSTVFGAKANPATTGLAGSGAAQIIAFYVGTGVQLLGEELFSILPFLAVLSLLVGRAHLPRKRAVILAWLVVALWFGAAHLPTYGWNLGQALLGIGVARLVLTLAYIRTKNLWVSTGAHILNDWSGFTFALVMGSLGH